MYVVTVVCEVPLTDNYVHKKNNTLVLIDFKTILHLEIYMLII